MIRKYHNHKPQTTPWHREEEPFNHHETPGRLIKQSNQLSLPHQDDCNARMLEKPALCVTPIAYSTTMRINSTHSLAIWQCEDIAFSLGAQTEERIISFKSSAHFEKGAQLKINAACCSSQLLKSVLAKPLSYSWNSSHI